MNSKYTSVYGAGATEEESQREKGERERKIERIYIGS